jgi:hypothetical protein
MVWNVLAIAIAVAALLVSSIIAVRQAALMFRANHIPVLMEIFTQLRSLEFNDKRSYIIHRLAQEHVAADVGISGLPAEARAAVYDVAGLYTEIAMLRLVGAVDRRIESMIQLHLVRTWEALAPFVYEERRRLGVSNMFWRAFEEFAADATGLPEGSINILIEQHRRPLRARLPKVRNSYAIGRRNTRSPASASPEAASDGAGAAGSTT